MRAQLGLSSDSPLFSSDTVVVEREVVKEVMVPGETVLVEREVVKAVEVVVEGEAIKELVEKEVVQRGRGFW